VECVLFKQAVQKYPQSWQDHKAGRSVMVGKEERDTNIWHIWKMSKWPQTHWKHRHNSIVGVLTVLIPTFVASSGQCFVAMDGSFSCEFTTCFPMFPDMIFHFHFLHELSGGVFRMIRAQQFKF